MSCKHKHQGCCNHENVKYCKCCKKVYCEDCGKEWEDKISYWYPTTTSNPYTTIGATTTAKTGTLTCSH